MIDWIKPNGTEITTNSMPETIAYAESLGWQRKAAEPERKKPGPKPKADK